MSLELGVQAVVCEQRFPSYSCPGEGNPTCGLVKVVHVEQDMIQQHSDLWSYLESMDQNNGMVLSSSPQFHVALTSFHYDLWKNFYYLHSAYGVHWNKELLYLSADQPEHKRTDLKEQGEVAANGSPCQKAHQVAALH